MLQALEIKAIEQYRRVLNLSVAPTHAPSTVANN